MQGVGRFPRLFLIRWPLGEPSLEKKFTMLVFSESLDLSQGLRSGFDLYVHCPSSFKIVLLDASSYLGSRRGILLYV